MVVSLIEKILTLIFLTLYESIMVDFYKHKIKKGIVRCWACSKYGPCKLFKHLKEGGFTYWFEALAFMGNTLCYIYN